MKVKSFKYLLKVKISNLLLTLSMMLLSSVRVLLNNPWREKLSR